MNDIFKYLKNNRRLVVGVGSALVDILTHEDDNFLAKTGAAKGGMCLVAKADIERTVAMVFRNSQHCSRAAPHAIRSLASGNWAEWPDL